MGNSSSTPCPHCTQNDSSSSTSSLGDSANKELNKSTDSASDGTLFITSSGSSQSQCPVVAGSDSAKCPIPFESLPWFSRRNKPADKAPNAPPAEAATSDDGSCGCGCVSGVACAPSSELDPKNLVRNSML